MPGIVGAQRQYGAGKVKITNNAREVHVLADVAGWYATEGSITGTRFAARTPARILDTRFATGTCVPVGCPTIGSGGTLTVTVAGAGGLPGTGATAVVMNTTVTGPSSGSFMTVWPSDAPKPNASNLNYSPGQTVPNLVEVKLGADGKVKLYNNAGTVADVAGWFNDGGS